MAFVYDDVIKPKAEKKYKNKSSSENPIFSREVIRFPPLHALKLPISREWATNKWHQFDWNSPTIWLNFETC